MGYNLSNKEELIAWIENDVNCEKIEDQNWWAIDVYTERGDADGIKTSWTIIKGRGGDTVLVDLSCGNSEIDYHVSGDFAINLQFDGKDEERIRRRREMLLDARTEYLDCA